MILEIDPTLSISEYTIEYFVQIYNKFVFEKTAFELWKVRNDHESFDGWEENLKMDHFMEMCWKDYYDQEYTFLYQ